MWKFYFSGFFFFFWSGGGGGINIHVQSAISRVIQCQWFQWNCLNRSINKKKNLTPEIKEPVITAWLLAKYSINGVTDPSVAVLSARFHSAESHLEPLDTGSGAIFGKLVITRWQIYSFFPFFFKGLLSFGSFSFFWI